MIEKTSFSKTMKALFGDNGVFNEEGTKESEIKFNFPQAFRGLLGDYKHRLAYSVYGEIEQALSVALMLLTGKFSPVQL